MVSKSWIRLKILSIIKSLSGNIVINYLLPNSFKYRLARNFVFNTKKVISNNQNQNDDLLDIWGNIKYHKYGVSNIIFDSKSRILLTYI